MRKSSYLPVFGIKRFRNRTKVLNLGSIGANKRKSFSGIELITINSIFDQWPEEIYDDLLIPFCVILDETVPELFRKG